MDRTYEIKEVIAMTRRDRDDLVRGLLVIIASACVFALFYEIVADFV